MSGTVTGRRQALIPVPLLVLSLVPLAAGTLRLLQLAGGPEVIPADDRFAGIPLALVVHITSAAIYVLVGAFQFVPGLRRRHLNWHRRAGRVLAAAAMLVVGSALWLTLFYAPQPGTGDLLFLFRLVVLAATALSLVLGVLAVRRRDIPSHRAWMIRAYALSLGAGTQVFTEGFGGAIFGTGVLAGDLSKGAAWAINLAVAEWVIRRPGASATPTSARKAIVPAEHEAKPGALGQGCRVGSAYVDHAAARSTGAVGRDRRGGGELAAGRHSGPGAPG